MTKEEKSRIIREKREELGYTVVEAAELAHQAKLMYRQIENGVRSVDNLSIYGFLSICKALDLDPMIFLDTY